MEDGPWLRTATTGWLGAGEGAAGVDGSWVVAGGSTLAEVEPGAGLLGPGVEPDPEEQPAAASAQHVIRARATGRTDNEGLLGRGLDVVCAVQLVPASG